MIRRLPALLLSVGLAAVLLAATGVALAQLETPPGLYLAPMLMTGQYYFDGPTGSAGTVTTNGADGFAMVGTRPKYQWTPDLYYIDVEEPPLSLSTATAAPDWLTTNYPDGAIIGIRYTVYSVNNTDQLVIEHKGQRTELGNVIYSETDLNWGASQEGTTYCWTFNGNIHPDFPPLSTLGCDVVRSGTQAVGANAYIKLSVAAYVANAIDYSIGVGDWSWITYGPPPPETQPPETHPGGGGASCVFTLTITATNGISGTGSLTETGGITETGSLTETDPITTTVVYSRNANLVANSSFESGSGGAPTDWDQVDGGAFRNFDWSDWWLGGEDGLTGSRYMRSGYPFDLYQDVSLRGPQASYVAGYFARCIEANCNEAFNLYWSPLIMPGVTPPILVSGDVNGTEYAEYTGTKQAAAGVAVIMIRPLGNGAYLDDVFVYPTDPENGGIMCDPALYPGPTTGELPPGEWGLPPGVILDESGGGITDPPGTPGPITGAGATCYTCNTPRDFSQAAVSYWIAWMGCVIRNMFACSLRVWLMYVSNSVYGVFQVMAAFMAWIPAQGQAAASWAGGLVQQAVNWIASDVVPGIAVNVSVNTGAGTNFFDVLVALVELINGLLTGLLALLGALVGVIADLIMALGGLLLGIAKLLIAFVGSLRDALAADPYQFDLLGDGSPRPAGADLAAAGANNSKILFFFMATLALIDQAVVGEYGYFLLIALGAIGFGVVIWTLNHWRDFLSF